MSDLERLLRTLDEQAEELVADVQEQLLDHLIHGTPLPDPRKFPQVGE